MTPLLFMGQEWAASTPFQFFTDFEPQLGALVIEGRRREFRAFPGFASDAAAERLPNPQAASTFEASRLKWEEQSQPEHASPLALHRALLKLRATHPALRASNAGTCDATAIDDDTILVNRPDPAAATGTRFLVCIRLRGAGRVPLDLRGTSSWRVVLSTEDDRFAPDPEPIRIEDGLAAVSFSRPGALMLSVDPNRSSSRDAR
jgi:maltooligosyltrehalose trehalohydrolase